MATEISDKVSDKKINPEEKPAYFDPKSRPTRRNRIPVPDWEKRVLLEIAYGGLRDAGYNIIGTWDK